MLENFWFSNIIFIGDNMLNFFRRFMQGRYGTDKLNLALLVAGLVFSILSYFFIRVTPLNLLLTLISYTFLGFSLFRCFSRNIYKRYEENRKFLLIFQRLRDKEHRYYDCPRCRQQVRVPRGKGKISITCPKCKEKFIKKT